MEENKKMNPYEEYRSKIRQVAREKGDHLINILPVHPCPVCGMMPVIGDNAFIKCPACNHEGESPNVVYGGHDLTNMEIIERYEMWNSWVARYLQKHGNRYKTSFIEESSSGVPRWSFDREIIDEKTNLLLHIHAEFDAVKTQEEVSFLRRRMRGRIPANLLDEFGWEATNKLAEVQASLENEQSPTCERQKAP